MCVLYDTMYIEQKTGRLYIKILTVVISEGSDYRLFLSHVVFLKFSKTLQ